MKTKAGNGFCKLVKVGGREKQGGVLKKKKKKIKIGIK